MALTSSNRYFIIPAMRGRKNMTDEQARAILDEAQALGTTTFVADDGTTMYVTYENGQYTTGRAKDVPVYA